MSQQDSEPREPDDAGVVQLHRATLRAVDFRKARFESFALGGCLFERCDFRGLRIDRRIAPFFTALPRSVFRDCHFDGADLRRVRLGQSRFERCTFDDALLQDCHTATAEFVGCRFAGPLEGVTFHGLPPGGERFDPSRKRNEFRGNDFRDADLLDVAFADAIDIDAQRWPPEDDLHVRLDQFRRRLAKARSEVKEWYDRDRGPALTMLERLAKRWRDQDVVFARRWSPRSDVPERVQARVWDLLERA